MSEQTEIAKVAKKKSSSGTVSYGTPVELHDSKQQRIQLIPFFIERSSGTEIAVKIQTYKKQGGLAALVEEKNLSLKEPAARRLLSALQQTLQVAPEADGSYLMIRVNEGTASLGEHDPAMVAHALTQVLSQKEIIKHLEQTELSDELVVALKGSIRIREMRDAVADLRHKLESEVSREQVYQEWCEKHSWAFGNAYIARDEVRNIAAGDSLDLILPTVMGGYRDIIELKRPNMSVVNYDGDHKSYYFASEVSKAIGQCHRYLDVLYEEASTGLRDHPEIVAYHPRATIVIGRSHDWEEDKLKALHGLNSRLNGVTIMTYDQLLNQGERIIGILTESKLAEEPDLEDYLNEEVPF